MERGKHKAQSAMRRSLACLKRREYTRAELGRRLKTAGYPSDQIEQALDTLEKHSLLSHRRFIDDYVRNAERKGYGPIKIRWELQHGKQLDKSEIEEAMSEIQMDWVACARRCCEKKFGGEVAKDEAERLRRCKYLFNRGFSSDTVRTVLGDK